MTPMMRAVEDYLSLRRRLGYKLRDPGVHLHQFIAFLERQRAPHITTDLALRWAMQPSTAQPAHWAARLRTVGSSPSTTPHRTLAPRSRPWDSCRTGPAASSRTSTAPLRSAD